MNEGCSWALRHSDHCRVRGQDRKLSEPHALGAPAFFKVMANMINKAAGSG